ncbi:mannose-6-phosphate isomerase [Microbacterium endophyticum]|uniref:mannose-6-phosphate isomerase n=1 Tax=Microbacterium endophyticum TaxID=1526412 RepID=A0A7W4V4V8_9MICO|nr:mannose-6-phosphate isomerase, class I [Microbacterium endophyticum]MBB2976325.1 mannose-6-phosphate isomerase [Microbacterium endophyticum]NIK35205.1 mannose-6-phosphate isomerase [Microbacterium endophyticum]
MLVQISNEPRDYAWGSTSLIARLQGRTPSGVPEAEVWFGDHPGSPAVVEDGTGRTLDAWLAEQPSATSKLPFLLKLLAAGSPLSIQVHPSKHQAEEGFEREEAAGIPRDAGHRNYRDDNHKPELIVAVSDEFEALAGLRPLPATRRLLATLRDCPGVRQLTERLSGTDDAVALAGVIGWVLSGEAGSEVDDVIAAVSELKLDSSHEFAREAQLIGRLQGYYPGDAGIVVALLMNYVTLSKGEAIFVGAGMLHAYVSGLGVELMAASDNVLRGGLTPKHIDTEELSRILNTSPIEPPRLVPSSKDEAIDVFDAGIADFSLTRVRLANTSVVLPISGPAIALVIDGRVDVSASDQSDHHVLSPGMALIASADEELLHLRSDGDGVVFVATPGR